MKKNCSKCHEEFECLAETIEKCHCNAFTLSPKLLAAIRVNYSNCLCSSCLSELISKEVSAANKE